MLLALRAGSAFGADAAGFDDALCPLDTRVLAHSEWVDGPAGADPRKDGRGASSFPWRSSIS